jgi:hypothetical protein
MCEFVSWIEHEGKNYFIQNKDLETKEGKKLLDSTVKDDLCGHGAILAYYPELKDKGKHKECTDFSSPKNFPKEIARALAQGKLSNIGVVLDVLNDAGRAKYREIEQPAWAKYQEIQQPALAKYLEIEQPAWAKYVEIKQIALAKYLEIEQPAYAKYREIKQTAYFKIVKQKRYRVDAWKEV